MSERLEGRIREVLSGFKPLSRLQTTARALKTGKRWAGQPFRGSRRIIQADYESLKNT